jgi:hypothetical protein
MRGENRKQHGACKSRHPAQPDPEKDEEQEDGVDELEEDVGEMESGRVETPELEVQPVGERGQGAVELPPPVDPDAVVVGSRETTEGTPPEILKKVGPDEVRVLADEILVIPEEIAGHGGEEDKEVDCQKKKDEY